MTYSEQIKASAKYMFDKFTVSAEELKKIEGSILVEQICLKYACTKQQCAHDLRVAYRQYSESQIIG